MRSAVAIGFIILYLVALCRPVAPLIEYYANQEYFAKVLCINRDKPQLQCNGKCILMQKLKKAVEPSAPSSTLPKVNFEDYPIGFVTSVSHNCNRIIIFSISYFSNVKKLEPAFGFDFFHPPSIS